MFRLALRAALLAAIAFSLPAQEYRGRVQGSVTDTTQAVIAGATVTLSNTQTGVTSTRQTNEQGRYIFDLVMPGTYSVTVTMQGFQKYVQENVFLQARADVTVDASLRPGDIREAVTVTDQSSSVQFNTSKLETTVDSALVSNLPQMSRNPLLLARLDPAVVQQDTAREVEPYFTWSGNRQEVGGGRNYSNDLQVDGSPIGIGYKTSYMPSPDAVQEVAVQQNAVDAEYGHSSGSAITLTMKSGTNQWHGNTFYQGQYPWANALENRVLRSVNQGRVHMWGGTLGNPIIKNKLFNFFSYEQWRKTDPNDFINTVPTDLERAGNFSQSLNAAGGLRTIYDPFTTETSADGRTVTRQPFPGNIIPRSQQDPIATQYMAGLWKSNRAGQGPYNIQNYYVPLPVRYDYHNISNRTDYTFSDRLRFSGRYSKLWTPVTTSNPTGSEFFVNDRGSQRDATSIAGDAVWTPTATTVVNINATYHSFVDASRYASTCEGCWKKFWPNSNFYNTVYGNKAVPELLPRMSVMGTGTGEYWTSMGPRGGTWDQRPDADSVSVKVAKQQGKHYLKMGADTRGSRTTSLIVNNNPGFGFQADATSATYVNPDLRTSGDGYATFLLGAIQPAGNGADSWDSGSTSMTATILPQGQNRFYGAFINDDWKITRDLTINMGLRYEFETAYTDPEDRLTRPLDLTSPIPEMQGAGRPQMPAEVAQYYKGPTTFNGAFQFADSNNRGQWNSGRGGFSPRIGAAYRVNDKTSFRVGYGRYLTPWTGGTFNIFDTYYVGYKNVTGAYPAVLGVPSARLRDPFPASQPVVPAYEKSLGRYTSLGDSLSYVRGDRPRSYSDRINISLQRQLPQMIILDVTFYMNLTGQLVGSYNINQVDPRIAYEQKDAINKAVANPFFNFSTVDKFPGALRYQRTVNLTTLFRQYPQYGNLNVIDGINGGSSRYKSFQLRLNRRFTQGYSALVGYNYARQQDEVFFNDIDSYVQKFSWQESDRPRHRLTFAGTWELPVGRKRQFGSNMPRALDYALGGWDLSGIMTWRSGFFVRFGGMQVNGDPIIENPTPGRWFNTQAFSRLPNFTPRTNPWQYEGLTNPGLFNLDMSIVKRMPVTEKYRVEMRMDVFNAANNMTWANPNTNVQSSLFGVTNNTLAATFGRRAQLGLRLEF
ncbi:MAG: carboxypeptidase regulatory-like domain-containing protein [Bryobacterales bacterium]|nr:carboxypeptidase regulatory-like domain-containing protein [Bryobacterales bacterium]